MANNRFFDESKIIKKNPPVEIQEESTSEIGIMDDSPMSYEEMDNMIERLESRNDDMEPIVEKPKSKKKKTVVQQPLNVNEQYKKSVQQIIEEEPEVAAAQPKKPSININVQNTQQKKDKPVYNYTKKSGQINIETKEFTESQNMEVNQLSVSNERQELMIDMLEKTNKELLRLSIELDIHAQVAVLIEGPRKQIYENKTKNIQDEIKYNEKRKLVLEKMLG